MKVRSNILTSHKAALLGGAILIVEACATAKKRGLVTIALVGFSGGALKDAADHCLFVPFHNYGIVEDMHQASVHVVTQYLKKTSRSPFSSNRNMKLRFPESSLSTDTSLIVVSDFSIRPIC